MKWYGSTLLMNWLYPEELLIDVSVRFYPISMHVPFYLYVPRGEKSML